MDVGRPGHSSPRKDKTKNLYSSFRKRAASLSRPSLGKALSVDNVGDRKGKKKDKDAKTLSLSNDLRISGPTNYRNKSVTGLFGIPLEEALKDHIDAGFKVPPFIEQVCLHIEQTMLKQQGIFRVSANLDVLEKCRNALNDGKTLNLWQMEEAVVCDLLKLYLRQLPEPLLTFELYDCFLAKAKTAIRMEQPVDLSGLVQLLPTANQRLLKRIVHTLRKVSQHSAENKMNEGNLGMLFGPNLLRAFSAPDEQLLSEFAHVNAITLALLRQYDQLFATVDYKPHYICYVQALFHYDPPPASRGELKLRQGDVLMVIEIHDSGWWLGEVSYGGRTKPKKEENVESKQEGPGAFSYQSEKIVRAVGYFPATYCAYFSGKECRPHDSDSSWET